MAHAAGRTRRGVIWGAIDTQIEVDRPIVEGDNRKVSKQRNAQRAPELKFELKQVGWRPMLTATKSGCVHPTDRVTSPKTKLSDAASSAFRHSAR
jgi:hypothetical protein